MVSTTNIDLDKFWEEAKGTFDLGNGLKMTYDVRPNMTKEEWKAELIKKIQSGELLEKTPKKKNKKC